jgi:quinol monooxygenase YgiN
MIVLIAHYTTRPDTTEVMTDAFRRMASAIRETEPGCRAYRVSQAEDDPQRWVLYEEYVDEAAFAAHRVTPHFRAIIEGEMSASVLQRERKRYELMVTADDV